MADRMLEAKSLRRLIERFIVIRKAYFTWLKSIARWRTMAPTPAPAARAVEGALYGGEQSVPDMDHYVVMKKPLCRLIVTKLSERCRFGNDCGSSAHPEIMA
jgi:hypothetical protein